MDAVRLGMRGDLGELYIDNNAMIKKDLSFYQMPSLEPALALLPTSPHHPTSLSFFAFFAQTCQRDSSIDKLLIPPHSEGDLRLQTQKYRHHEVRLSSLASSLRHPRNLYPNQLFRRLRSHNHRRQH